MARAIFVKKARKAKPDYDIKVGDSYWWWSFRTAYGSTKHFSKSAPRPSQLTASEFRSSLLSLQEWIEDLNIEDFENLEAISAERDEIISELEQLRDETQDKLDNMPEPLQEADTGQLLQDRIDALESFISDVECVDGETVDDFIESLQNLSCDAD